MTRLRQAIELLKGYNQKIRSRLLHRTHQLRIFFYLTHNLDIGLLRNGSHHKLPHQSGLIRHEHSYRLHRLFCIHKPPRRIPKLCNFSSLNRFPCPHGRDVSHRIQNPLLGSLNLVGMNVK